MKRGLCLLLALWGAWPVWGKTPPQRDQTQITAKLLVVTKNDKHLTLTGGVTAHRPLTGGHMTSSRMELKRDLQTDKISWGRAEGQVTAYEGEKLMVSEYATFDDNEKVATLQGQVIATTGELFLFGHLLRYDYELEKGRMWGEENRPVHLIFHKKKPDELGKRLPMKAWAKEILLNRPALKITLEGEVKVVNTSDGSEMRAERMELFLNEQEEAEQMIAEGSFTLAEPGRQSKAKRAIFDFETEIITLLEEAFVRSEKDDSEVKGDHIEMHQDRNKGILSTGKTQAPLRMDIKVDLPSQQKPKATLEFDGDRLITPP